MSAPALSFVVVADSFAYIRELVDALQLQPERGRIELVVGTPSGRGLGLDEAAVEGLAVRVVETGPLELADARTAAARAAGAPHVFLGETHCLPGPGWARAILAAHAEGWDTVVPALANGNPHGTLSWAGFLLAYGRNWAVTTRAELDAAPSYNVSVRRDLVGAYLEAARSFNDVPRGDDRRILRTPAARMAHVNVVTPREWLDERFAIGRIYGAGRSRAWSGARRAAYVAAAPLLPVALVARVLRLTGLGRLRTLPPLTLPAMLLGSIVSSAGEVTAYAGGSPSAALRRRMDRYELHRSDYAR